MLQPGTAGRPGGVHGNRLLPSRLTAGHDHGAGAQQDDRDNQQGPAPDGPPVANTDSGLPAQARCHGVPPSSQDGPACTRILDGSPTYPPHPPAGAPSVSLTERIDHVRGVLAFAVQQAAAQIGPAFEQPVGSGMMRRCRMSSWINSGGRSTGLVAGPTEAYAQVLERGLAACDNNAHAAERLDLLELHNELADADDRLGRVEEALQHAERDQSTPQRMPRISRDHFALLARRAPLPALPTHLESHTHAFLSAAPADCRHRPTSPRDSSEASHELHSDGYARLVFDQLM